MIRCITLSLFLMSFIASTTTAQLAGVTFLHNSGDASLQTVDLYVTQSGQTQKVENINYQVANNLNSVFIFGGVEVTFDVAPGTSVDKAEAIATHSFIPDADAGYMVILTGVASTGDYATNPDGVGTALKMTSFNVPFFSGDPNEIGTLFFHGSTDHENGDARVRGTTSVIASAVNYNSGSTTLVDVNRDLAIIDITTPGGGGSPLASFEVDLSGLSSESIIFVFSGFKTPADNQGGAPLSLLGVLETGSVIKYSLIAGSQTALVQVIHNSGDPSLQVMDVWMNEERIVDNMAFHSASSFTEFAAGTPVVIGFAPFGSASWADTIKTVSLEALRAGRNYQIVIQGIIDTAKFSLNPAGADVSLTADLVGDALTATNDEGGRTVVRTVHGSTDDSTLIVNGSDGAVFTTGMNYREISATYTPSEQITDTLWVIDPITQMPWRGWVANLKGNKRATVLMSTGFKDPAANENGPAFKLILVDATGNVVSNLKEIDPDPVSVQEELLTRSEWTMSPNPANSSVVIDLPSQNLNGVLIVGIFDLSGANLHTSIHRAENGAIMLNTNELASGSYQVRISMLNGQPVASNQLLIQR